MNFLKIDVRLWFKYLFGFKNENFLYSYYFEQVSVPKFLVFLFRNQPETIFEWKNAALVIVKIIHFAVSLTLGREVTFRADYNSMRNFGK